MGRPALIFDIETVGDITDSNRDAISALVAEKDIPPDHYAALCPPLARVVCIAWYDTVTSQLGAILDSSLAPTAPPAAIALTDPQTQSALPCFLEAANTEADLLTSFGRRLEAHAQQASPLLVTFNGRGFDLPVLLHRAVKHQVGAGRALLTRAMTENRYSPSLHLDLMDAFTFNGATRRYPLAAYALGYGFPSPKDEMSGAEVGPAVAAGRIVDVARYCAGDVLATTRVYRRWVGEA